MNIEHINHSSVLIETDGGEFVLTDPWFISPAFGGWTQNPSPPLSLIKKILSIPKNKLTVVISHGHDDHLDEFVISHHFRECTIVIPKFPTPGLEKRITSLTGKAPTLVGEDEMAVGSYRFSALINEDFTHYDAIILISDKNGLCIHANDNWHAYPEDVSAKLENRMKDLPKENVFFLSQLGIADCFPISYPNFSDAECDVMINIRIKDYAKALMQNISRLGLKKGFSYANQSQYDIPAFRKLKALPYELYLKHIRENKLPITQLQPGMVLGNNTVFKPSNEPTLFSHMLEVLQKKAREYIGINDELEFRVYSEGLKNSKKIIYSAPANVWQRILIGELTLEALAIGGMGLIFKNNTTNIRDIHIKLSKFSYIAQSQIRKSGLGFYGIV